MYCDNPGPIMIFNDQKRVKPAQCFKQGGCQENPGTPQKIFKLLVLLPFKRKESKIKLGTCLNTIINVLLCV
jgi:hypothetical protein